MYTNNIFDNWNTVKFQEPRKGMTDLEKYPKF